MKVAFKLGNTVVHAVVHQKMTTTPTMLNVHDDEDTSVAAGKVNIEEFGGRVIELTHSGTRLITFELVNKKYLFDPNRMFSDAGIAQTLKNHNPYYSAQAQAEIKKFAAEYIRQFALDQEPVIIALHNTVDGVFSVESFTTAGYLGTDAAAVNISPRRSKFDFFFVTTAHYFDFLKEHDFNVVLQDNEGAADDGSLSVYFARKEIPYINIEAAMNHLPEQIEMLKMVRKMLTVPE